MGNGWRERTYGVAFERQAASLREVISKWAQQNSDLQPPEALAHLLNLAFQIAFVMGSDPAMVRDELVTLVNEASDLYGVLAIWADRLHSVVFTGQLGLWSNTKAALTLSCARIGWRQADVCAEC